MTDENNLNTDLPTNDDLKAILKNSLDIGHGDIIEKNFKKEFYEQSAVAQKEYEHVKGLRDHYSHKKWWSYFLMFLMFGMVAFQSVLLGMVGSGLWDFSKYKWLLPLLLAQNLAQVVGLAVFVVKSLFKDLSEKQ